MINMSIKTGEVWKLKSGNLVIISKILNDGVEWVDFNIPTLTGTTKCETYTQKRRFCLGNKGKNEPITIHGLDYATRLACTVKQYIKDCLNKSFDF